MQPLDLKSLIWLNKNTKDTVNIRSIKNNRVSLQGRLDKSNEFFDMSMEDFSKNYEATYQVEF